LRRIVPFPARVIFSDGGLMPPQYYPRAAHLIHHVAQVQHEAALAWGIPAERSMMVPCGLSTRQFAQGRPRAELRRQYGIRDETFVILAVSAVKKVHKRVDHIIEEASRLEGDFLLWIDGQPDDADLVEVARRKLGDKCRLSCVPTPSVPDLYHFSDVFVHAALEEGFGLAICEAASAGLPLAIHDSPHFRWLLDDPTMLVDMRAPGQLAAALQAKMSAPPAPKNTQLAAKIAARFDWDVVAPQYLEMYRRAAAMPERDAS
jgi:glycosyltransferase involved in cell wall biosynthesis